MCKHDAIPFPPAAAAAAAAACPQKLSCRVLKSDEVHPQLFKGANRKFKKVPWKKIEAERVNKERTPEEAARRAAALIRRDRTRQKRITAAGIDYDYEPLAAQQPAKSKKIKFN
jgi:nucleolar protein 15